MRRRDAEAPLGGLSGKKRQQWPWGPEQRPPGGGWGGQEQGARAVGGRETSSGAGYRATCPLQYLLGLVIASLEEGEEPTHVESRCSEAV